MSWSLSRRQPFHGLHPTEGPRLERSVAATPTKCEPVERCLRWENQLRRVLHLDAYLTVGAASYEHNMEQFNSNSSFTS